MEDKATQLLKKKNLRITSVRKKVLEVFLDKGHEALSNTDIEKHFDKLNRITLYRTMRTFTEKGLIHRLMDRTGNTKFAQNPEPYADSESYNNHAHFFCLDCGKTVCLNEDNLPVIPLPNGYEMLQRHLVLSGKCNNCR